MSLESHWNNIFEKTNDEKLGWWENDISQTLKFLDNLKIDNNSEIFLSGAGTSLLVDELVKMKCNLVLNDISEVALKKLKDRLGKVENIDFFKYE